MNETSRRAEQAVALGTASVMPARGVRAAAKHASGDHQRLGTLVSVDEALETVLKMARPVTEREVVPIGGALGRVLLASLRSPVDVPPADNSAVDGYAVHHADLQAGAGEALPVSQRITAGRCPMPLTPGSVARIFTGAPLPRGADVVVMQEYCRRQLNGDIVFDSPVNPGDNIRRAGEDIKRGNEVLPCGYRLRPQDIGLAASVGTPTLAVARRLRVATLSSGDELAEPGDDAGPGQIFNSNRYLLSALLDTLGCSVVDMGCVPDSRASTIEALRRGAKAADVLITSGGMAVGDEDHMRGAAAALGELTVWGIAMKPGKPLAFGRLQNADFFGLPGNPVALLVGFCLFVRPFLLRRMGVRHVAPETVSVRAAFELPRPCARRQYLRARLETQDDGERVAHLHHNQSSGVLSSTVWAHGLVVVPENAAVAQGQTLRFMPFSQLID